MHGCFFWNAKNANPDHKKIASSDVDRQNRKKASKRTRVWVKHLPVLEPHQKSAGSKRRKTKNRTQENADDSHWQQQELERYQVVALFRVQTRLLAAVYPGKQPGCLRLGRQMKLRWCNHTVDGKTIRVWLDDWYPDMFELVPKETFEEVKGVLQKLSFDIEEYSEHDELLKEMCNALDF